MPFTSLAFGVFLLVSLLAYYALPKRRRWWSLLAAGAAFYAVSDPWHLPVLAGLTLWSFAAGRAMAGEGSPPRRALWFWAGLVPVVLALVGFRTLDVLVPDSPWFALPLGISFFSLRLISYLVDVHRNAAAVESHAGRFLLYASLFPTLPAGPIDRAGTLLPQLRALPSLDYSTIASGVKLFAWGLFKKIVVADRLRPFVAAAYDAPGAFDSVGMLVATVLFAFQIYCDFSGYSDMAIGLGEMFGLKLTRNFDRPYHARSIAEFWTRWHISFSSWLRDYVFLPLAYKADRLCDGRLPRSMSEEKTVYAVASVATMVLCGLWHGVTATYVAWGLVVALLMTASVATKKWRARLTRKVFGRGASAAHDALRVALTFGMVNISWVFFRSHSIGEALRVFLDAPDSFAAYAGRAVQALSGALPAASLVIPLKLGQSAFDCLVVTVCLALLAAVEHVQRRGSVRVLVSAWPRCVRWPLYAGLVIAITTLRAPTSSTFIYAGF